MSGIKYYSWVPFFKSICSEILKLSQYPDSRASELSLKAKMIFKEEHAILKVPYTDPFSFLYAFAQLNTTYQRDHAFKSAKSAFNIPEDVPTDLIFPTPSTNTKSLFYAEGQYVANNGLSVGSGVIWDLFDEVFNNKPVTEENFAKVLSLKNVGVSKLTQTIFLVNPEVYIPFDTQMNSLPIPTLSNLKQYASLIDKEGFPAYKKAIDLLKAAFPGCYMYEVNLLNVLLNEPDEHQLRVTNRYCQISSWADGKEDADYFDDFVNESSVWTGGATSGTGKTEYPLQEFDRGDIVLVRKGTKNLGGVGIVLENEYKPGGWSYDAAIKIVWLNKNPGRTEEALAQWTGFDYATPKTITTFQNAYGSTFEIINQIRGQQKIMVNHALNKYKNIILQGPPGTGKTRLAKQIARWLVSDEPKDMNLMEAIDQRRIITDPEIESIEEITLIQFHPAYSYEDFVRGIVTVASGDGIQYKVEDKTLAKIAAKASKVENQGKAYVLIIDEINRANLPAVLGELIYALEYRGRPVDTMYAIRDHEGNEDSKLVIPHNLYIIGTMNTADRSVGHIDYAIRRRFSFVRVVPDVTAIKSERGLGLYHQVMAIFKDHTAPDFNAEDVAIGHSYFLGEDGEMALKLKYDIKPLLLEYISDGVLKESAKIEIDNLHA